MLLLGFEHCHQNPADYEQTQCTVVKQNAMQMAPLKLETLLITIQSPSQIPCTPHELLILVLLHLQLPLSLDANSPNAILLCSFPVSFLADIHALQESCRHGWGILLHERRAVCHVRYFAVLVC